MSGEKGTLEIKHLSKYQPFQVGFTDLGCDTIQVDVTGGGSLNYDSIIDEEMLILIKTNVNNALYRYGQITSHKSSNIGFDYDLKLSNKIDRKFNSHLADIKLFIVFKKPVMGASAYSLQPTIRLITTSILNEIFILKDFNWKV